MTLDSKKSVVYQIYPKSFMDGNGDGIGDIRGIISKLDYLEMLGIDLIWLSPIFKSPQEDNGYDISDYEDVDPLFGNKEDLCELIKQAQKRNIGIMLDLVLNHSSDEHFWFKEACKSKDNPYHDYYVWRDGKKDTPPNDMKACFGGSAWEWVEELNQYYFHQFAVKQPDLNWENENLRNALYKMINNWSALGVKGFRLDVIDQIAKEPDKHITANGPKLHDYLRELSKNCFQNNASITVGEAWGADVEKAKLFSNPDNSELTMVFQFEHVTLDTPNGLPKWDATEYPFVKLKQVIAKWQKGLHKEGRNSLFWDNHDLPRAVSAFGNDSEAYREISAKMLAIVLHGLEGTPYIYQGEELGMTNVYFEDIKDYVDIETLNMYKERMEQGYSRDEIMASIYKKGRDNARTPMQWNDDKDAGFTQGTPWIKVNPNYVKINAKAAIKDDSSIFHTYKKLISLRKELKVISEGDFELLYEDDLDLFVYTRTLDKEKLMVYANFHDRSRAIELPADSVLISNYSDLCNNTLRPYEAIMFHCVE